SGGKEGGISPIGTASSDIFIVTVSSDRSGLVFTRACLARLVSSTCACVAIVAAPFLRCRATARLSRRYGTARANFVDSLGIESQFFEYRLVVLSEFMCALCGHLGDVVHLHGATDCRRELLAGALERNNDAVLSQLWILDDVARIPDETIGDACL